MSVSNVSTNNCVGPNTSSISVNERDYCGETPLMKASWEGDIEKVRDLLKTPKIKLNSKDDCGHTALMHAVHEGHIKIVKELLKFLKIDDVNDVDDDGDTALTIAASKGHIEIVKELLKLKGIDIDHKCNEGRTALVKAASLGLIEVVRELLQAGAGVDYQSNNGNTALMHAVAPEKIEIVKELLKAGADVNVSNNSGVTALMYAAYKGHIEIVKLLIKCSYVDKDDECWINKLENQEVIEILKKASQENNVIKEGIEKGIKEKIQNEITAEITKVKKDGNEKDFSLENLGDEIDQTKIVSALVQEQFDKRLYMLEQHQQSKEKEIGDKISSIEKNLVTIGDKTKAVYEKNQQKLDQLREQRKLYFNPSIRTFYFTIQSLFETRLISMMLLLGRIIKREDSTIEKSVVGTTEVAVGALEVIPVAGTMAGSAITTAVREIMSKMGDDIKLAQAKRIQKYLGNPKGASKFAEFAARKVAQKYEEVIRSKKVSIDRARYAGEKVAKWMFQAIDNERKKTFDYFFVNNVLIPRVEEQHKKKNLFEDKSTKKKVSKAEKRQVANLSRDQQDLQKELELLKEQQKEFKITSLTKTFLDQFNVKIKEDFNKTKTKPLFEMTRNNKILTLVPYRESDKEHLQKITKWLSLFSQTIVSDWEIKEDDTSMETVKYLQIEARSTETAKELMDFFNDSNLPVKIKT